MSIIPISLLIVTLLNTALGSYVLLNSKKSDKSIAINFFFFALFMSFWIFCFFLSSLQINYTISLIAARLSSIGALFLSFCFMLFVFGFTSKKLSPYLVFLIFLILSLISFISLTTNLYIKDVIFPNAAFNAILGDDYLLGDYYFVIPVILTVILMGSCLSLLFHYKKADNFKKNQIKYLFIGVFVTFLFGFIADMLLPFWGIRTFNYIGPLSTIFIVLLTAYAITKHHLMDINVVIRKSLVYTLITGVFTGLYLFILLILSNLFGNLIGSNIITTLIMLIAFAFGFQPLKEHVQQKIDKLYFKGKYDYQQTLKSLSSASVTIIDLKELLAYISSSLNSTINPESIHILLSDPNKHGYQEKLPPYKELPMNSSFASFLSSAKHPILLADLPKTNSSVINGANSIEAYLSIPLFSKNALIGIISLGPKKNEEIYSEEDINLLSTLANHLATSIENSLLHEEALSAQKRLIQADKISALGNMAAGLAHEIKNPLSAIKGLAQMNKEAYKSGDIEFIDEFEEIVPKETDPS